MATLDERIAAAQTKLENASSDQEKAAAKAEKETLESLKAEGLFTQDDLNRVDKQNKDKLKEWEQTVGSPLDQYKEHLARIEQAIVGDNPAGGDGPAGSEGDDPKGDATNVLERVSGELSKRDQAIESEREARLNFERELRGERITGRLNDTFRELGLNDKYLTPARRYIRDDINELVEKAMKGEEVTAEEVKAKVESVKADSPVWFEPEKEPYPGVPSSPQGGEPRQLTDEERLQRSESVI